MRIACIGAGVIGRSWAFAFARAGYTVNLYDADASIANKAMQFIGLSAKALEDNGGCDASATRNSVNMAETLADAVADCGYVQESVEESAQTKMGIFQKLDLGAPNEAILASSTSSIAASGFTADLVGRSRCLVVHPVNPPHLIPLVEICPTPWTSPGVVEGAASLLRSIGQVPIVIKREVSGFVLNRLQMALIGEALHLVGEGVCTSEDVDKVVTHGLGLPWALMGPFASGHLNSDEGYAAYMRKFRPAMEAIGRDLKVDYKWTDELLEQIESELRLRLPSEAISAQQQARDRVLLALRSHLDGARPYLTHPKFWIPEC